MVATGYFIVTFIALTIAVISLVINLSRKGEKGEKGDKGSRGETGPVTEEQVKTMIADAKADINSDHILNQLENVHIKCARLTSAGRVEGEDVKATNGKFYGNDVKEGIEATIPTNTIPHIRIDQKAVHLNPGNSVQTTTANYMVANKMNVKDNMVINPEARSPNEITQIGDYPLTAGNYFSIAMPPRIFPGNSTQKQWVHISSDAKDGSTLGYHRGTMYWQGEVDGANSWPGAETLKYVGYASPDPHPK